MLRTKLFCLFLAVISIASLCNADPPPPKASTSREAWQSATGKCGMFVEKGGVYEFAFDSNNPGKGNTCVVSVGTDVIGFAENKNAPHKQYLFVPLDRIILRILR